MNESDLAPLLTSVLKAMDQAQFWQLIAKQLGTFRDELVRAGFTREEALAVMTSAVAAMRRPS